MAVGSVVSSPWRWIRVHWSASAWLPTAHVVTGLPIALGAFAVVVVLAAAAVLLAWTVVVPVAALLLLFWLVPVFSAVQRARFVAFLSRDIPPVPRPAVRGGPIRRLLRLARVVGTWRQLSYHLLAPMITGIGFLLVVGAWSGSLAAVIVAVRGAATDDALLGVPAGFAAVALLVVGPWVARGVAAVDVLAAESLLGPSLSDRLVTQVEDLRESRAGAVEAADAERRRIERDLHDGAQQRLVSLAMYLGVARATLTDIPAPARAVIVQAHEDAKNVLTELRGLIRGLHPAVLNDQGLDAALSGLVARAPMLVRLSVEVAERASPTVEAVAFFVVSETLTNVAKHAGAEHTEITVRRVGDLLRMVIVDDGCGGADPQRGTGLRGLAQRVGSVDGTLRIDSPSGGPTTIRVDLPCG